MARHVVQFDVATDRGQVHVRATAPRGATQAAGTGGRGAVVPSAADAAGWGRATADEPAVLLVHGNCSSSAFFQRVLARLPDGYRGVALDLRGFGESEPLPIDATNGMRDFADDVLALMVALGIDRADFVAHSAGAGVVMQLAIDHPERVGAVVLEAPMSPYGFGGTRGPEGAPVWDDHAGSGGGTANPDFAAAVAAGDRSTDHPHSPLNVFRAFYVAPGFAGDDEDLLLDSVLSTRIGDDHYPGTTVPSPNWPGVAPGATGMNNAISPAFFDVSDFAEAPGVGPVTWVRGDLDAIISDTSMLDLGHLGALGVVPGWPGEDVYPAQPMVSQMRSVLDRFAANGGTYTEVVLEGVGHSPHLEAPERFLDILAAALTGAPEEVPAER
ncbi:alpha/beta hydrolase [Georgenia sp. AZ-5]|uniref:alpha/beta hydrolase n=1 Tax=Georgenia sp. AZ-5 TaxID=3367526 RepID=UPI0037552A29